MILFEPLIRKKLLNTESRNCAASLRLNVPQQITNNLNQRTRVRPSLAPCILMGCAGAQVERRRTAVHTNAQAFNSDSAGFTPVKGELCRPGKLDRQLGAFVGKQLAYQCAKGPL